MFLTIAELPITNKIFKEIINNFSYFTKKRLHKILKFELGYRKFITTDGDFTLILDSTHTLYFVHKLSVSYFLIET